MQDDGTTTTTRVYYSIAGMRVAMEEDDGTTQTVYYFLTDHLGSTVGVLDDTGTDINILLEENRYTPFGEVRDITGSLDPITGTDFGYTGQRDLGGIGLMDYNARFYSPGLRRFIQPDTIIPGAGNPQSFNRFSYVKNNPMKYVDPSGHIPEGACGFFHCATDDLTMDDALSDYNIVVQNVPEEAKLDVFFAAYFDGRKFADLIGGGITPWDAFILTKGGITLIVDPTADTGGEGNCKTDATDTGSVITCKTMPMIQTIIAEFGHAFDNTVEKKSGEFASGELPAVYDITGFECESTRPPCLHHSWERYPVSGRTLIEAFADVYMNWILDGLGYENGLTDEPIYWIGDHIYSRGAWMEIKLEEWLPLLE